jgi:hypothetical protein
MISLEIFKQLNCQSFMLVKSGPPETTSGPAFLHWGNLWKEAD